jgi:hypothetical protein
MAVASSRDDVSPWDQWWRIGGLAGILFIVLLLVGIAVQGSYPDYDKPIDEVRDWYTDNGEQFIIGNYLVGLAFVLLFLPFLSSLRGVLAAAEGGQGVWSRVVFAAGLAILVLAAVSSIGTAMLAFHFGVVKEGDLDDGTVLALGYLEYVVPVALAFVPFTLAASLVIVRTGVLWRWLAIPGLVIAVLAAIAGLQTLESEPYGGVAGIGGIALPLTALWILLVSVNMILKKEAPVA